MDWLSQLLALAPVAGQVDIRCRFGAPWRIEHEQAPDDEIPYHVVLRGTALLDQAGAPPLRLRAGDVLLFPRGAPHTLHDESGKPGQAVRSRPAGYLTLKETVGETAGETGRETAGGEPALDLLCGRFLIQPQQGRLIRDYLPAQMVMRPVLADGPAGSATGDLADDPADSATGDLADDPADSATGDSADSPTDNPAGERPDASLAHAVPPDPDVSARRLRNLLVMMRNEASGAGLGGRALLNALSTALFTLILRHASLTGAVPAGLLALTGEPRLAPAIDAMFQDPGHPWTLEALAERCNMSRATFVRRFQARVGRPAMTMLSDIRMALAVDYLQRTDMSTAAVADAIGYQSEAAFQRAFKLHTGRTPAAWRAAAGR